MDVMRLKIRKMYLGWTNGFVGFRSGIEIHWNLATWALPISVNFASKHVCFIDILFLSFSFEYSKIKLSLIQIFYVPFVRKRAYQGHVYFCEVVDQKPLLWEEYKKTRVWVDDMVHDFNIYIEKVKFEKLID